MFYLVFCLQRTSLEGISKIAESQTILFYSGHFFIVVYNGLSNENQTCGCRIVAITTAFQAVDDGSIPFTRSKFSRALLLECF